MGKQTTRKDFSQVAFGVVAHAVSEPAEVDNSQANKALRRFEYAVKLVSTEDGGYVVSCRDLPQLVTQGDDVADALMEAADAMDEIFVAYMRGGLSFPAPTHAKRGEQRVSPPAETVAKAALYVAMHEAGVTKVQLAKKLGVDEKELSRLLDPHCGAKLARIAQAINALGHRLVIGLETL